MHDDSDDSGTIASFPHISCSSDDDLPADDLPADDLPDFDLTADDLPDDDDSDFDALASAAAVTSADDNAVGQSLVCRFMNGARWLFFS